MTATHTVTVWLPSISADKSGSSGSDPLPPQYAHNADSAWGQSLARYAYSDGPAPAESCWGILHHIPQETGGRSSSPLHRHTGQTHNISTSVQLQRHGFQAKCHQHWDTVWFNLVGSTEVLPLPQNTQCFYCVAGIPTISKKILATLVHISPQCLECVPMLIINC